jgi:hypothetical protein
MVVEKRFTMKTHRDSLVTILVLALGTLVPLALAEEAKTSSSEKRVYTNADLSKYASEDDKNRVTNKQLKEPLPSQAYPIAGSQKEDWSFVLAMIDREHEAAARSRGASRRRGRGLRGRPPGQDNTIYGYAPYYGYGYGYYNGNCVNGNCNGCNNGPFTHRSNCTPQQTNTMRPLDERGISTPRGLWREASRNAAIHQGPGHASNQGGIVQVGQAPAHSASLTSPAAARLSSARRAAALTSPAAGTL